MAKQLWDGNGTFGNPPKTFKTYATAVKKAEEAIGGANIRFIVAASADGRFFPVALGHDAIHLGLHFKMCVAA